MAFACPNIVLTVLAERTRKDGLAQRSGMEYEVDASFMASISMSRLRTSPRKELEFVAAIACAYRLFFSSRLEITHHFGDVRIKKPGGSTALPKLAGFPRVIISCDVIEH